MCSVCGNENLGKLANHLSVIRGLVLPMDVGSASMQMDRVCEDALIGLGLSQRGVPNEHTSNLVQIVHQCCPVRSILPRAPGQCLHIDMEYLRHVK